MEAQPGSSTVSYSPHTRAAYWMPNWRFVYRIAAGAATRLRLRKARRARRQLRLTLSAQRASDQAHIKGAPQRRGTPLLYP
jgi:hypothetical protein